MFVKQRLATIGALFIKSRKPELFLLVTPQYMDIFVITHVNSSKSSMHCKFAPLCRYYDDESSVCNHEDAACEYCGTYSDFEGFVELKRRFPAPEINP